MKKIKILLIVIAVVVILPIAAVGVFLASFDANNYRPQISDALEKQLGRKVALNGPLKLSLSWSEGFNLSVSDVEVGNPSWAKRPLMAKIGEAELGVGIQPLLAHKLEISSFGLSNADVQLETNSAGQTNWDFQAAGAKTTDSGKKETVSTKGNGAPVAIVVNNVKVSNGHIAMIAKDGSKKDFVIDSLTLKSKGQGIDVSFAGKADDKAIKLTLTGDALDRIMKAKWPFTADLSYANYSLHLAGSVSSDAKNIKLDNYTVTAGSTKIAGTLAVALGGARPAVQGTLTSDKIDPADLKPEDQKTVEVSSSDSAAPEGNKRLFSTAPLDLSGLKAADAKMDISIGELVAGATSIKQFHTKLDLADGRLALTPLSFSLAGSQPEANITLNAASSPAQMNVTFKAQQIDLSQLAEMGAKLGSYVTGKADFDLTVTSSGNSMHDLASNANGHMNFISDGGKISTQILGGTASSVLGALSPGVGSSGMTPLNCLATRFKIVNGVMQTDGMLADAAPATISGTGDISLRDENINMVVHTKPKGGSIKGIDIGAVAPAVGITGPLTKPSFAPNAVSSVQNVAGMLLGGGNIVTSPVPDIASAPAGQNACVYTLDHPQAAKAATQTPAAPAQLKDTGKQLLQGLGGLFGKQK